MTDRPLPPHLDPRGRRRSRDRSAEPGDIGPAAAPGRQGRGHRDDRGRLRRVALGSLVLLLVLAVGLFGLVRYYDGQIDRVEVAALGQGADVDGGDTNYLLVGNDSRRGFTEQELQETSTEAKEGNEGSLTDTIVLIHVPAGGAPALVSFPRDAWVEIAGRGRGRINSAYAAGESEREGGGPDRLVQTVSTLSGLSIDHYLEVGLVAFLRITDALGGVEVNLCAPQQEIQSGIDLAAGEQQIGGVQALAFVRQRSGLPRGDLDRVARQQYFLGSVARQTLSAGTLLRPWRVLGLLDAGTSSIVADEDLSVSDLARLGLQLRGVGGGGVPFLTVPVADPNANRGGASVVLLDEPALPGFFAGLSPSTPADDAPNDLTVPASAIRLEVRNGTTRAGLAAQAAEDLRGIGFTVQGVGTAEGAELEQSVVLHGTDRADSARTVAGAVPGAQVRQDDGLGASGLVLVLGSEYLGTRAVQVGPPPAAPPAPAPGAPAPGAPAPEQPAAPAERPCIT